MYSFERIVGDINRLTIPFDNIYTSVFLIVNGSEPILVDSGASARDVDGYIIPALSELGISLDGISTLVLTHSHRDHAGGVARILEDNPNVSVITEATQISDSISTYPLPGHSDDSLGVFDRRTHTLISGDGIQGAGVDKYRTIIQNSKAYLETLDRIKKDTSVENLLFSHAYEPWYRDSVFGRTAVIESIDECYKYIKEL